MSKITRKMLAWTPDSQGIYVSRQIEKGSPANQRILKEFAEWLVEARGLGAGTITHRVRSTNVFLDAVTAPAALSCEQALAPLTAERVEELFVRYGKDRGMPSRRNMQAAMRLFLKFAAFRGWVARELSNAVPSLLSYRGSGLPRGLSEEQLSTLLALPWDSGWCPRRDRAIVELLASYGVRRQQVSALQLSDIDWRERTILFAAHKGGKAVHHVLTSAVAQSLVEYLCHERPTSDCTYVFLRRKRPYLRLSPMAISCVVSARMVRCGLPRCSAHALRHTFATRLLRAGQPVKAIADLLGHRSLAAVAIYAKVDVARLLEVAVDWPEVVP